MVSATKNIIIKELDEIPEEFANEILNFVRFLKFKSESDKIETYNASESSLKKDWLKPEEDEAWKEL